MGWESPRLFLIGFPIVVVLVSILLQGAAPVGGGSAGQGFCNYNSLSIQCTPGAGQNGSTQITCPATGNACTIAYTCPATISSYPPSYCSAAGWWILPGGYTITVPNALLPGASGTSAISGTGTQVSGITASFAAIGTQGWTLMIGTVLTIAVVAGFNFFGSGESNEGVHILFETVLLLGIWVILSVIEGITTPGSTSMFIQLNRIPFYAGVGTLFYVILSLFYTMGVGMWVSRGGL